MRELPTGTVTFLFTDIEGSTKLLQELGDAYADALAEHRRVLREAFAAHCGVEVDTQGDAFFVAFARASDALAAAAQAQQALDGPIKVRIGLHTGEPLVIEEGYVGIDVHRAARIAAAGHGGQVLVSRTTHDLAGDGLRDLGEHRLKDLSAPERIYQLGDGDYPPLKTLYQTNLPVPATPFLGREDELTAVGGLLADNELRLLTLTGAGGSGKTRLALQAAGAAADGYPGGIWWVPLAPVSDPEGVLEAAAGALGVSGSLDEAIGARRLLLLLDNFEHLIEAAPQLSPLLASCPNLDLVVTSRERLQLQGEQVYPVPVLARSEARTLFTARARAVRPDFEGSDDLEELCARLDDLPLALELAAARVAILSTDQLLSRLGSRLDLLRGGRDAEVRQQTLRATIEWSYDLLDPDEQRLLARLAVFRDGCTLEAAEAICDADIDRLQSLVDKSLVRVRDGQRFWTLETIWEFAAERLRGSEEEGELRRRHAEFFLALGEAANLTAESEGPQQPELVRPDQDNFRTAIDWAAETDLELAFRLAISLEEFWVINDPFEGVRRFAALLDLDASVPPHLRARAMRCYAESTFISADLEGGDRLMQQTRAMFERLGDEEAVAVMIHRIGVGALVAKDFPRARELFEESLARGRSPKLGADLLHKLAWVEHGEGNPERALELFEESAVQLERVGFTWMQANAVIDAAEISSELGQTTVAEERGREGLRLSFELADRQSIVYSLALLARFAAAGGNLERAGRLWGAVEAEAARGRLGYWEVNDRERFAPEILAVSSGEFEAARLAGQRLSLDEAVELALS